MSGPELIQVFDVQRGQMTEVPADEAAAGVLRYARSLGPGTAACAVWEQQAAELAQRPMRGAL